MSNPICEWHLSPIFVFLRSLSPPTVCLPTQKCFPLQNLYSISVSFPYTNFPSTAHVSFHSKPFFAPICSIPLYSIGRVNILVSIFPFPNRPTGPKGKNICAAAGSQAGCPRTTEGRGQTQSPPLPSTIHFIPPIPIHSFIHLFAALSPFWHGIGGTKGFFPSSNILSPSTSYAPCSNNSKFALSKHSQNTSGRTSGYPTNLQRSKNGLKVHPPSQILIPIWPLGKLKENISSP